MTVIPIVVQQHAEDAAFLWMLRELAVRQPHYELMELSHLDERVEAHVDGLRVNGEPAWDILAEQLEGGEAGEVFAAGVLALESDRRERIDKVFAVAAAAPELERGLISAHGWVESNVIKYLDSYLTSKEPAVRRIGLGGFAVRRKDLGLLLKSFLNDHDPRVRARALKTVGELGRYDLLAAVTQAIRDPDDDCRFYAAWTAARLGQRYEPVMQTLVELAEQPGPRQMPAFGMALRSLDVAASKAWLRRLGPVPQHQRLTTIGIGVLGDPVFVGKLFELMKVDEVARVAGESFSMITGVDLADDNLERNAPEGFESGPNEDPTDQNVAMDEDENLPWPDAELVGKWWSSHGSRFQPGRRYLRAREITPASARQTLVDGKQRQRAAAAIELALLQPTMPLFEVRARGSMQQKWLKA